MAGLKRCSSCDGLKPVGSFCLDSASESGRSDRCVWCIPLPGRSIPHLRVAFLAAYGGVCVCCGETNQRFLTLDHVQNDGAAHRAEKNKSGVYDDALASIDSGKFQILCFNCNMGRNVNGGVCPHQHPAVTVSDLIAEYDSAALSTDRCVLSKSRLTRTHCVRGHEFTPSNTHIRRDSRRVCLSCLEEDKSSEFVRVSPHLPHGKSVC